MEQRGSLAGYEKSDGSYYYWVLVLVGDAFVGSHTGEKFFSQTPVNGRMTCEHTFTVARFCSPPLFPDSLACPTVMLYVASPPPHLECVVLPCLCLYLSHHAKAAIPPDQEKTKR